MPKSDLSQSKHLPHFKKLNSFFSNQKKIIFISKKPKAHELNSKSWYLHSMFFQLFNLIIIEINILQKKKIQGRFTNKLLDKNKVS